MFVSKYKLFVVCVFLYLFLCIFVFFLCIGVIGGPVIEGKSSYLYSSTNGWPFFTVTNSSYRFGIRENL